MDAQLTHATKSLSKTLTHLEQIREQNQIMLSRSSELLEKIDSLATNGGEAAPKHDAPVNGTPQPGLAEDSFEALVKDAVDNGNMSQVVQLLRSAAELRIAVESASDTTTLSPTRPKTFTHGPKSPHLVFMCTSVFSSGVHNYKRIAASFDGVRTVSAVPLPGFYRGTALPDSPEAAVESLAQIVAELVGDEPFTLAGQSSGGKFAYALAKHFESAGNSNLTGVALLDTHNGSDYANNVGGTAELLTREILIDAYRKANGTAPYHTARLTAMATWTDMLPSLYEGPLETDVLFVQCSKPWVVPYAGGDLQYPPAKPWPPSHTVRTLPVDHISILVDGAELTAQILEEWINGD
ncbi:hypothetical protein NJB18091_17910 [Mycobacterium marinum]|uniref:thioesterase domain-containing protein n=1 Tax=Mycobacterium marinum TaxID=1781 RepID=UPI0021C2CF3F|nr:thioesterase domain-containing protein [Mycobacterium marinum]GJN94958.1 hypothetical protein NJB18091_17910 [Mycobacterium marinum]